MTYTIYSSDREDAGKEITMKTFQSHEHIRNQVSQLTPAMRYDNSQSFRAWQKSARAKLEELLGLPLQRCEDDFAIISENQCEGYKHLEFTFQSEPGYYVSCDMLIPDGIQAPLPTAICLQGHSTGKHISVGKAKFEGDAASIAGGRDFAVRAVKEGCCAITLEQRYMGTAGQNEKGSPACISRNEGMAALLIGRTAIGERVWDIQRLIDVMEKHLAQYVDVEKIICMGNSGGGTATFYASCMDERIYLSMPSCSVCTYEDSIMAMYHCPCNFIPGIRKYFDMGDLGGLIADRRLVVVCGDQDPIFPLHGVKASFELIRNAYRKLGRESLCQLVVGKGGHQFYPDDAWPVVHKLLQ